MAADSFDWVNLAIRIVQVALIPGIVFLASRFLALKRDINGLGVRLAIAEREIQQKPGSDVIHELALLVKDISGDMKEVRAELKGVRETLRRVDKVTCRHEDYLLHKKD